LQGLRVVRGILPQGRHPDGAGNLNQDCGLRISDFGLNGAG
jgi:hypothetical protein